MQSEKYVVWSRGGINKFFNTCIQEHECASYDDAMQLAEQLSKKYVVAGVNLGHNWIAYFERGQLVNHQVNHELPKARINLGDDDDGLTAEQQQWIDNDIRSERDTAESIMDELRWIADTYLPVDKDSEIL